MDIDQLKDALKLDPIIFINRYGVKRDAIIEQAVREYIRIRENDTK